MHALVYKIKRLEFFAILVNLTSTRAPSTGYLPLRPSLEREAPGFCGTPHTNLVGEDLATLLPAPQLLAAEVR